MCYPALKRNVVYLCFKSLCHAAKYYKKMNSILRLAIVEDNATARTNLRSHLLPFGCFNIFSYSNGNELRSAIKRQTIDIILIDYHLGSFRNGAESVHQLRTSGHIKPSTGVFFVTSDREPKTIAQIMETHPDVLIVKPYTMGVLGKHMGHYLELRKLTLKVLRYLDANNIDGALRQIRELILEGGEKQSPVYKFMPELNKLFARILLQSGYYSSALTLYESVLRKSSKVLWAQWGKIKAQYMLGNWLACDNSLQFLTKSSLTHDKAYEWLACLSAENEIFEKTSQYLEKIKTTDLSLPATRLLSLAYRKQNKVVDGINLLQKQREHNRSIRDRFDELTYELAEFYLAIAESTPSNQRTESLHQARKLIGVAARGESDIQLKVKKDVLLAFSASLDGDNEKAGSLIGDMNMITLQSAQPSALFCAAKVLFTVGDESNGRVLIEQAETQLERASDQTWRSVEQINLSDSEKKLGLDHHKALELNEQGMKFFKQKQTEKALPLFYQAFQRLPTMPAFMLNLLQCLVYLKRDAYRSAEANNLLHDLEKLSLNESNQYRLEQIVTQMQNGEP